MDAIRSKTRRLAGPHLFVDLWARLPEIVPDDSPDASSPLTEPLTTTVPPTAPRRVQAVVALRLLEVMRDMDLPVEVLEEEDPTRTIPRRFGLSGVVDRQIRSYRDDVRRGARLTDDEVQGLFRFVIRRPDSAEVFQEVGRLLAYRDRPSRWTRLLPRGLRFRVARSAARRRLRMLFGRHVGGFGLAPFSLEGRALLFVESDPGGDACHLISGFAEEVLTQVLGAAARVHHTLCQGRGDELCRWEGDLVEDVSRVGGAVGEGTVTG